MSTPGTGDTGGERRGSSADGSRRGDAADNPTELIDTSRSGAGASSAGRADTGSTGAGDDGHRGGSGYVPGAYSADDDASGDYVPGMYSGDTADAATTREHIQPLPAPRDASATRENEPTTQATRVVPVTATRDADPRPGDRDSRLPAAVAAGRGVRSGMPSPEDRKLLHQREKQHFGGMKFGSAFFGWLTATGMFVLLSALVGTLAAVFGFGAGLSSAEVANASGEAQTTGITAAVVLGVVLLVSYFAGGYVAGRMARFSGAKQGVAVWLWALIVAVVLAVVGFVIGNRADLPQQFQNLGIPSAQELTGPGLIGLLIVAAVALVGAILGGLTGMRYHRRIDRADYDALEGAE